MSKQRVYKPAPLATVPKTLNPDEYYNLSPEYRRIEEKRAALRAQLKREFLLKLNDPYRKKLIEDPAFIRWTYVRNNFYPNFRPTPKSSMIGLFSSIVPLVVMYNVIKHDRVSTNTPIT
ncbi:hypothetical protein DNTS_015357, partial [Danionella cerebrum]